MLLAQIRGCSSLPERWQTRVAKTAEAHRDIDLLVELAQRTDCPAQLTSTLVEHPDHRVRTALVKRTGINPEVIDLVAAKEKNSHVLAAMCRCAPDKAQTTLQVRFSQKPTVALALGLLHADWISDETALGVLQVLSGRWATLDSQSQRRLDTLAKGLADRGNIDSLLVVSAAGDSWQLLGKIVPSTSLSAQALLRVVLVLEAQSERARTPRSAVALSAVWATVIQHPQARDPQVAAEIDRAILEAAPNLAKSWARLRNEEKLVSQGDPDELVELAAQGSLKALQVLALTCTNSSAHLERALVQARPEGEAWLVENFASLPRSAQVAISKELTIACADRKVWDKLPDPDGLHSDVLAQLTAQAKSVSYGFHNGAVTYALAACPHLLGQLPWQDLAPTSGWNPSNEAVAVWLDAALDDAGWECFLVLAGEWTGTLDELISACQRLTRD